jgi:hypothetical protein
MISNRNWKLFLPAMAAGLIFILPVNAQTTFQAAASTQEANTLKTGYDLTKEIKIQGTISKIDTTGTNAPIGTHILVQTPQGVVDAHLGFGLSARPGYLGISEGQSVTIVGMNEAIGPNQVLLARLLTTSNRIFVLRNEHGIPVRGVQHNSPLGAKTQKGGL